MSLLVSSSDYWLCCDCDQQWPMQTVLTSLLLYFQPPTHKYWKKSTHQTESAILSYNYNNKMGPVIYWIVICFCHIIMTTRLNRSISLSYTYHAKMGPVCFLPFHRRLSWKPTHPHGRSTVMMIIVIIVINVIVFIMVSSLSWRPTDPSWLSLIYQPAEKFSPLHLSFQPVQSF